MVVREVRGVRIHCRRVSRDQITLTILISLGDLLMMIDFNNCLDCIVNVNVYCICS